MQLFQRGVAAQLYHFHSVQQGLGNGVQAVRCTHKQHMGQIIRLFYEMIAESIILLPIQHFKECGRVAVMRNAQLIHLVQKHQRIYSSCLLHRVNDAPRHRANICPPVSANFRFILYAAQRHTDIFPV